jgi:gluconokinase
MHVLAIDLGTSSARSAVFDARGTRLANSLRQESYALQTAADGRAELDPAVLLAMVRRLLAKHSANGVGISCFWHSLMGCDGQGRPLTPIYTWADSRCTADAARLRRRHDERELHARTGCMLRASFWPAKLAWLRRTAPQLFARVAYWVGPAEWILWQLTGELRCAHGMATATGLYNPLSKSWDPEVVRLARLRLGQLPPISDAPLTLPGLGQVFPGIGDGAANNLGVGATAPGLAAINFGTSAAVRIVRERGPARAPFGLFCYRIDERRHLIGGAISNAGGLRAWCLDRLRLPNEADLERELAARPGPHPRLRALPFWLAERAPSWREDLSGTVLGITQSTTAVDLLQAITEATYQRLANIVALVPGAQRNLRLIVGGGLQKSPASFQRLADCIGMPLIAAHEPETSLRGAAVFALERLGAAPAPVAGRSVRPRAVHVAAYARQRKELARLEATLFPPAPRN